MRVVLIYYERKIVLTTFRITLTIFNIKFSVNK
jgi:hypothetical protein